MIDELIDRPKLADDEKDYLTVLTDLVADYEAESIPMPRVEDAEMLAFLLQTKGVSQAQAAKQTTISESTISEVLSGKRRLNRGQIGKLSRYFHVEPGVFYYGE